MSPDGSRLAAVGLGEGLAVWELPTRRSWVPVIAIAGLLAGVTAAVAVIRRIFKRRRARPAAA